MVRMKWAAYSHPSISRYHVSIYRAIVVKLFLSHCFFYSPHFVPDLDHVFLKSPSDETVVAGNPVTLPCRPPLSDPPANVSWFYENTPLVERTGPRSLSVLDNGTLSFSSIQIDDGGVYICTAVNDHAIPQTVAAPPSTIFVHGKSERRESIIISFYIIYNADLFNIRNKFKCFYFWGHTQYFYPYSPPSYGAAPDIKGNPQRFCFNLELSRDRDPLSPRYVV